MGLKVITKKVCFSKETKSGFWAILQTDKGTAKGVIRWLPQADERLSLTGDWTTHQGEKQFAFNSAMPDVPENPQAQLHYCCELASGVGPVLEDRIWQAKGEDWKDVDEGEVKGLSGEKYKAFTEAAEMLELNQLQVKTISWLLDKGLTWNMASKAYDQWGKDTMGVVSSDVYQLSYLPNYSFQDADKLRSEFGIGDEDPRRIKAAVFFLLHRHKQDGHTVMKWDYLAKQFRELISVNQQLLPNAVAELIQNQELVGWRKTRMMTDKQSYDTEKEIWNYAGGEG